MHGPQDKENKKATPPMDLRLALLPVALDEDCVP